MSVDDKDATDTRYRTMRTSDLVRLLASGAPSADDHEGVAKELDRRLPPGGTRFHDIYCNCRSCRAYRRRYT